MAMSWVYRHVVQAIGPRLFGFIDHDLIPLRHVNLTERIGSQPCFGMLLQQQWAWQLWAGYCFFDYRQVARLPLNFLYDFSNGLDTGGRNWRALYRHLDVGRLKLAPSDVVAIRDLETRETRRVPIVDDAWYHIGGISYNDNFKSKASFAQRFADALDQGQTWSEIRKRGVR